MKILLHDLSVIEFEALYPNTDMNTTVISDNGAIHNCIGCFGCWLKTPGVCVLKDNYNNMGELLSKCDELKIISRCIYGSYSPLIRNVLDRSISYLLPYFISKNAETHHAMRYKNKISLSVHFYGSDITENEKETAKRLVKANCINFCDKYNVNFHTRFQDLEGVVK